jgi:hypothetical protein
MIENVYKKRPAVGSRPVFFVEEPECKPEKLKKPYLLMAVKSGKVIILIWVDRRFSYN